MTNRAGATVEGLTASSFTIMEDNTPVPIGSFGSQDVACSVGVVVDLSGSMQSKGGHRGSCRTCPSASQISKTKPSC